MMFEFGDYGLVLGLTASAANDGVSMAWYIPLLIFTARILDVSMGTIRMILVISGSRYKAAALGFFEVIIWVLAVSGVFVFLSNPIALIAYAAGFSAGTLVGMVIEDKLAMGYRVLRVINSKPELHLCAHLREHGYRVTRIEGKGRDGPVEIAFAVVRRRALPELLRMVNQYAPLAFVTVERADQATMAAHPGDATRSRRVLGRFSTVRK
ncbi:MAG: DUF2179 domain-containing protein [Phycisphaeraceae bacterium]|nr:MAG: DUF2179 domain-containing protein [Phycisphaeraceae bacterium]